jgi:transposase
MSDPFVAIGIDASDAHHDVCISGPTAEPELSLRIPNDLTGFQRLLDEFAARWPNLPWRFALENPKSLLARFLLLLGHCVFAPNPLAVARTREGMAVSGQKSDALDARVLAKMLREAKERRLVPLIFNSPQGTLLAGLVAQRRGLVQQKTRLQNQLTALLKGFYPRLLELFADLDAPLTLAALQAFPSPSALKRATAADWEALFRGQRYPRPGRIPTLFAAAQAPQVPLDPVEEQLGERQVCCLVRLLEVLLDELGQIDQAIAQAFEAHPDADFFRSLPGAGPVLGPSLLAVLGDNRQRWQDWKQIATTIGTAPITKSSGRQKRVLMRFHCDREARDVLHRYAQCILLRCDWARAYYDQQRAAGQTHSGALRSLSNKWLRILYRMWQDRQPYDEAAYLAALQRRKAPKAGLVSEIAA